MRVKEPRAAHVFEAGRCSCADQWRWEERAQSGGERGAEAHLDSGAAEGLLKRSSAARAGAAEARAEECARCGVQDDASAAQLVSRHDLPRERGPTHAGEGGAAEALFAEFGDGGTLDEVDPKPPDAGPLLCDVLPGHLNIIGAGGQPIGDEAVPPQAALEQYEIDQYELDQRKRQSSAAEATGTAEAPGSTEAAGAAEVLGSAAAQREHAEPQSSRSERDRSEIGARSEPQQRAMPQSIGGELQASQRQAGRSEGVAGRVVPSLRVERAGHGGASAECRFGARCTRPRCNFRHPAADGGQMAADDGGGRRHGELQDGGEERRQRQRQRQRQVGEQPGRPQSAKRRQRQDSASSSPDSESSDSSRERRRKRQKQRGKGKQRAADGSDESEPQRRKQKKLGKGKQRAADSSDDSERQRRRKQKRLRQKQKQKRKPAESESADDEPERRRRPQRKGRPQRSKRRGEAAADSDSDSSESDGGASGQPKRARRSADSHAPSKASSGACERDRARERERERESSRRLALDGASDAPPPRGVPLRKWHGYARAANQGSEHPVDMREVGELLLERAEARASRDFVSADRLREALLRLGVELSDQSMQWRLVPPSAAPALGAASQGRGAAGAGRAVPGTDSTEGSTLPARAAQRGTEPSAAREEPPSAAPGGWCYLDAAEQLVGPVSVGTLRDLHRCGVLRDTTLVRSGEQDGWSELRARGLL